MSHRPQYPLLLNSPVTFTIVAKMSLISQEAATEHFTTSLGPLTPSSFLSLTENRSSQIGTFSTYSAVNFPQVHSPTVLPSLSVKAWGDLKPLQRQTIVDVLSCAISSVLLLLWWFLPFAFSLYTRWVLSAFIHIHVLPNLKKIIITLDTSCLLSIFLHG